jgi:MFS family permease
MPYISPQEANNLRRAAIAEDETTPLIAPGGNRFRNPFRNAPSLRDSFPDFPRYLRSRSSSPFSDAEDERVDIDTLQLSLARVGSLSSSGPGLGPGAPQWVRGRTRPSIVTKADAGTGQPTDVEVAVAEVREIRNEAIIEEDEEESKYIGITVTKFWLIFSVIMLCYFIACFDSTLMASSHPVITSYFDASQSASWLSTVFLITSTGFQPLFGRVSDTIGRKSVFLLAILVFALTTLWCALAGSIGSFIAARAVCGLGAGGTMSMSLIIISDLVRIEDRGVFQSHLNFAFGLGSAAGAAFGGFLCDSLGWRWAFGTAFTKSTYLRALRTLIILPGIQIPFLAVAFIAAVLFAPNELGPMLIKRKSSDLNQSGSNAWEALRNFDSTGSALLLISVTFLILALNLGGNLFPWISTVVLTSFAVFAVTATCLVLIERHAKQPVMPLRLLTKPPVANMVFANFLGGIASNTVLFNVPLFFQAVLLASPTSSGLRLAVPSIAGSLAGISTGYIITYTRRLKPTLMAGAIIYLLGSVAMMFINENVTELLSLVLITGVPLGQGFVFPNTMMSALAVSPQVDQAVVTTTLGLWRSLGVVMGVAVSSLVFQNLLAVTLEKTVQGEDKDTVIEAVRRSVGAIRKLKAPYQAQGKFIS